MILDGTECPVRRPIYNSVQQQFYSGKKKKHTIKYEIAVQIDTGKIVWVAGGVSGNVHDLTLTRTCGILNHLLPGEHIMADLGYIGELQIITPIKMPRNEQEIAWNSHISSIRILVENSLCRIKNFNCLTIPWRHERDLHPMVFTIICNLVNLEMIQNPIR